MRREVPAEVGRGRRACPAAGGAGQLWSGSGDGPLPRPAGHGGDAEVRPLALPHLASARDPRAC